MFTAIGWLNSMSQSAKRPTFFLTHPVDHSKQSSRVWFNLTFNVVFMLIFLGNTVCQQQLGSRDLIFTAEVCGRIRNLHMIQGEELDLVISSTVNSK